MADVKGGRGVTGMSFSGKGNLEKPSSGKLARELGSTVSKTNLQTTSGSYPRIGFNAITPPGTSSRMLSQKFSTKYKPGEYAAYRKALAAKKPVVAAKPVVKPVVKPAAQVISNVTNAKPSPTKKATPRAKPPATRFGVVTGKTTGTTMRSSGGGYGGGGTRGGGSLSGGGSGTRSAGTSRTGGTQRNDPVRG
jgi:uncharacterized membrane protein YgcG